MKLIWSAVRWYRRVLPVPGLTLGAIVLFFLTEGLAMLADFNFRRADQVFADHNPLGGSLCVIAAIVYGGFRVFYFQPLWRPKYRDWLRASPWSVWQPLPEGPVMLSVQDILPLALLTLGSLRVPKCEWYVVPVVFLSVWIIVSTMTFSLVGPRWLAYGIVFAAGGLTHTVFPMPMVAALIFVAIVVAVQMGHFLSLSRFHEWDMSWTDKYGFDAIITSNTDTLVEMQQKNLNGWPFDQMAPDFKRHQLLLSPLTGFLVALMVAWHVDGAIRMMNFHAWRPIPFGPLGTLVSMLGIVLSMVRAGAYVSGHAPPLGFFGRLATGRLIIPGYDYIFLAPVTVATLAVGGAVILGHLHTPPVLSAVSLLFMVIFLITTMPPDLAVFHLTGNHRINPDMKQRTSAFLIKD
ncbi:MAG: hypothetical protein KDA69_03375 [Planctomycetaceae bacterium]|nr:hypothetical protein [Planctomycetaceae bacterium]